MEKGKNNIKGVQIQVERGAEILLKIRSIFRKD